MGWVLLRKRGKMFLGIDYFTMAFYTGGMFLLGMINIFQSGIGSKWSLRTVISIIQGIGYGVVLAYFLVVIFQYQELTPAFELLVAALFLLFFVGEVVETTLLFSQPEKYLPDENQDRQESENTRFRTLKKLFAGKDKLVHFASTIFSLVVSFGVLVVHLLIVTGFLFI